MGGRALILTSLVLGLLVPVHAAGEESECPPVVSVGAGELLDLVSDGPLVYAIGSHASGVWLSRSTDSGQTWTGPEAVHTPGLGEVATARADVQSGRLAIAMVVGPYNDGYGGVLDGRLEVVVSEDGGLTFSTPQVLDPDMGMDVSWSWDVAVDASGTTVAWSDEGQLQAVSAGPGQGLETPFLLAEEEWSGVEVERGMGFVYLASHPDTFTTHVRASGDGGTTFSGPEAITGATGGNSGYMALDRSTGTLFAATGPVLHRRDAQGWATNPNRSAIRLAASSGRVGLVERSSHGSIFSLSVDGGMSFSDWGGVAKENIQAVSIPTDMPLVGFSNLNGAVVRPWNGVACDIEPPTASILSGPPPGWVTTRTATFTFESSEPDSTFLCDLDGLGYETCTSPTTYEDVSDGFHAFNVKAIDKAGNVQRFPTRWTWTVDATAPRIEMISYPTATVNSTTAVFEFTSDDPQARYQCSVDGGWSVECTSPWQIEDLGEGEHQFLLTATDAAGNRSSFLGGWSVDTTPPRVTLSEPRRGSLMVGPVTLDTGAEDAVVAGSGTIRLKAEAYDSHGLSWVRFLVDGVIVCDQHDFPYTCDWTATLGSHEVTVEAIDLAGNVSDPDGVRVTVI